MVDNAAVVVEACQQVIAPHGETLQRTGGAPRAGEPERLAGILIAACQAEREALEALIDTQRALIAKLEEQRRKIEPHDRRG